MAAAYLTSCSRDTQKGQEVVNETQDDTLLRQVEKVGAIACGGPSGQPWWNGYSDLEKLPDVFEATLDKIDPSKFAPLVRSS